MWTSSFPSLIAALLIAGCAGLSIHQEETVSGDLEVVILGIAQDGGIPQIGDACLNCRAGRKGRVTALGIIDPVEKKTYLIDATPDMPSQWDDLVRAQAAPSAIFLTHAHMGHYLGLAHLGREALGARGIPVYATESMIRFLSENGPWDLLIRLGNIAPAPIEPKKPVRIREGLSVTPIISPHRQEYSDTVGYVLEGTRRILYVPDTDRWSDWERDIGDICREVDVAILDGTFYSGAELPGRDMTQVPHPLVTETVSRLRAIAGERPGSILFTHLNHTNPLLDPDGEERAEIEAMGFGVAREGIRFPL